MSTRFSIFICIILLIRRIDSCTPFGRESLLISPTMMGASSSGSESGGNPSVTNNNLFPSSVRARGENTHIAFPRDPKSGMSVSLGTGSSPPITESSQLNCEDFDESCRWRNVDGLLVDELDWYQGAGELDKARLAVATATHLSPEGAYAIAATDTVQFPAVKAILVSDQISCQVGDGEIRFMYWTSPDVQLKVCVKKMSKVYPDFDFCRTFSASIEKNDPGPVFINIPDQGVVPFQIYIIADHFTFNSDNLKGGFAIIDSIQYNARMCGIEDRGSFDSQHPDSLPLIPLAESRDESSHVTAKRSPLVTDLPHFQLGVPKGGDSSKGIMHFTPKPNEFVMNSLINLRSPSDNEIIDEEAEAEEEEESMVSTVCEAIVCSFNESEPCTNMARQSDWPLSNGPVGNPLTGIRGDASSLPFSEEGSFAYTTGPQAKTRLQTPSFAVDRTVTIVFSYYKADKSSSLQAILKKEHQDEVVVFKAPQLNRNSRRWFRESLNVPSGQYDYLAFQVSNLRPNNYIGIDEMFVVDDRRKSFCFKTHL